MALICSALIWPWMTVEGMLLIVSVCSLNWEPPGDHIRNSPALMLRRVFVEEYLSLRLMQAFSCTEISIRVCKEHQEGKPRCNPSLLPSLVFSQGPLCSEQPPAPPLQPLFARRQLVHWEEHNFGWQAHPESNPAADMCQRCGLDTGPLSLNL